MFRYVWKFILYIIIRVIIIIFFVWIIGFIYEQIERHKLDKKAYKLSYESDILTTEGNLLNLHWETKEGNKKLKEAKEKEREYHKTIVLITDKHNNPPLLWKIGLLWIIILVIWWLIALIIYIPYLALLLSQFIK